MSALADISDEHELNTGRRQEGIFYSARTFFAKVTNGIGHLIAGIAAFAVNEYALAETYLMVAASSGILQSLY